MHVVVVIVIAAHGEVLLVVLKRSGFLPAVLRGVKGMNEVWAHPRWVSEGSF